MFRGARRSDLEQILEIYAHARKAMADSGNPTQWGDSYPPQEMLEEDIDSNRLFVYVVNGQLMGVFAFLSLHLELFGLDAELAPLAAGYLRAMLFGLPGMMLFVNVRGFLEGYARTRPAMIIGILGLALNVPCNYVLIYGKLGLPHGKKTKTGWSTNADVLEKLRELIHLPNGILLVTGPTGSGKTTIGRAIMRILPTSGGEVLYKGQKINGKISRQLDQQVIKEIQMIFQDPQSSLNERAKVSYIVGEGLQNVRPDLTAAQREEKVRQALLDVGLLPEFASRFPHEFSGGQRQRIGIARALIVEPEFIIADEPISALDMSIRAQVLNLLRHLQKERGITYLFIAHDLSVMRYISDRIAVIHKGDIVELADAEELVTHAIHPYTRSLLSAIPMPNPRLERKKKLLVYDPAMHDYTQEAPQWRELRPSHWVLCSEQEAKDWLAEM